MDSAIGTSLVVAIGPERFAELLAGFHAMDEHFRTHRARRATCRLLMGLLNVWYTNFLGAQTHAVLPYAQLLHRFPAYLQQLTMESNGKGVRWDGTAGHHRHRRGVLGRARHQRPARVLPADPPGHPARSRPTSSPSPTRRTRSRDGDTDVHELFLANFFAQTQALAFGKTADEVRAEGTAEAIVPARVFPGNRPDDVDHGAGADPVGARPADRALRAHHLHRRASSGASTASTSGASSSASSSPSRSARPSPATRPSLAEQDASTQSLIAYYRKHRR